MRFFNKTPKPSGFTLIELLIVVAIIAILAAIAVPNFLEAQTRSKVSRVKSDMRTMSIAQESFYIDNNYYPPDGFAGDSGDATFDKVRTRDKIDKNVPSDLQKCTFIMKDSPFLTTPLAFLTTIPRDPFSEKDTWLQGSVFYLNKADRWKAWDESPKIIDDGGIYPDADGKAAPAWVMFSAGPDGHGNPVEPTGIYWTPYDPTNGTVSFGDIYKAGP